MSKWILRLISDDTLQNVCASSSSFQEVYDKLKITSKSMQYRLLLRIRRLQIDTSRYPWTGHAWNKGLTKNTHHSIQAGSILLSERMKGRGHPHTIATREKLSKAASDRSSTNGYVRTRWYSVWCPLMNRYVSVQGTWERNYAQWLNQSGVPWIRSRELYLTWTKGETDITHRYFPDFYLPDTDVYVEIKGYLWKSGAIDDDQKMRLVATCNPHVTVQVLRQNELKELGIL